MFGHGNLFICTLRIGRSTPTLQPFFWFNGGSVFSSLHTLHITKKGQFYVNIGEYISKPPRGVQLQQRKVNMASDVKKGKRRIILPKFQFVLWEEYLRPYPEVPRDYFCHCSWISPNSAQGQFAVPGTKPKSATSKARTFHVCCLFSPISLCVQNTLTSLYQRTNLIVKLKKDKFP